MDSVSHALWGATLIRTRPQIYWGMFFGILPDLPEGIFYIIYVFKMRFKDISYNKFLDEYPSLAYKIYYFSHNFFTGLILLFFVYLFTPKNWVIVSPYFLHLFLDFFSHREKWASPMFWPISRYRFKGFNWWTNKWLTTANWLVLILVNLVIWVL